MTRGAALRAWTSDDAGSDGFDDELDSAIPVDLDPLHRYDLRATFLTVFAAGLACSPSYDKPSDVPHGVSRHFTGGLMDSSVYGLSHNV